MGLSLDTVTLAGPDVERAGAFYSTTLTADQTGRDGALTLDMRDAGRLALAPTDTLAARAGVDPASTGFRGFVLTCILDQPTEVRTVMDTAARSGAECLKPATKALFGSFSGVFRAPDGAVWKVAAGTNRDTGTAAASPRPSETTLILGVADPKRAKAFYEAWGLVTDRDYGTKYVDFHPDPGAARLGLMRRDALAKDAGVAPDGDGFAAMVLTHHAASAEEVDRLLADAAAAGGRITTPAARTGHGYTGYVADPDGFLWDLTDRDTGHGG